MDRRQFLARSAALAALASVPATSLANETDEGLKASAFAKHANDVYAYIQCAPTAEAAAAPTESPQEVPNDPKFGTCAEANDAGYGDYAEDIDPEYD